LAKNFGADANETLSLQLSHAELEGMIGTATESCIQFLSELNKSNLIELVGKRIKIVGKNTLRRLID
jgi:hypothetical protein